jgi:hypothetical protein
VILNGAKKAFAMDVPGGISASVADFMNGWPNPKISAGCIGKSAETSSSEKSPYSDMHARLLD